MTTASSAPSPQGRNRSPWPARRRRASRPSSCWSSSPSALLGATTAAAILLGAQAVVFLIAAVLGVQRHPYGYLYKAFIRPRLKPPVELEDPAPPTFAQGVGLFVVGARPRCSTSSESPTRS